VAQTRTPGVAPLNACGALPLDWPAEDLPPGQATVSDKTTCGECRGISFAGMGGTEHAEHGHEPGKLSCLWSVHACLPKNLEASAGFG
jgi:hypothetical protein